MIKLIQIIITGLFTSLFFFPISIRYFPGVNSKMALAVVGLFFLAWNLVHRPSPIISKRFLILISFAAAVSLASLVSITINQTPDTSYVGYIASFSVWLSAAYTVCCFIKGIHGRIDVKLALNYLVSACIFQCIMAVTIESVPAMQAWVVRMFPELAAYHKIDRLYGLGAALDFSGTRFAAVLIGLGFYLSEIKHRISKSERILYILSFVIIATIGNMIARTTSIGMTIAIIMMIAGIFVRGSEQNPVDRKSHAIASWIVTLSIAVVISVSLYNNNPDARRLIRFGFEGFFSLVENGRWETSSTNILQRLVVFPETLHTWFVGDGYFENSRYDINYLGDATTRGYYMGTDIGYLRFLFYFGFMGLIPLACCMIYSAIICMKVFRNEWILFFLSIILELIIWAKVSTDILPFLAFFLSTASLIDKPKANA